MSSERKYHKVDAMTIQEQVEQFRQNFQPSPLTDMHGFDKFEKQYYALLRAFLEECCRMDKPDPPIFASIHVARKRRHFAWLEEK